MTRLFWKRRSNSPLSSRRVGLDPPPPDSSVLFPRRIPASPKVKVCKKDRVVFCRGSGVGWGVSTPQPPSQSGQAGSTHPPSFPPLCSILVPLHPCPTASPVPGIGLLTLAFQPFLIDPPFEQVPPRWLTAPTIPQPTDF